MLAPILEPEEEDPVARYADTLLSDGERIALRTRQHWLATFVDGRVPWAIFIAAIVLLFLRLQVTAAT